MMKRQFTKTALALAVAGTLSAPAFANDGYAYSGANARSQALQLNYFSHADRGNVWVNPALAGANRNSAEITVRESNDNTGGVFYGFGDNHTVGVYIGRASTSTFVDSLRPFTGADSDTDFANTRPNRYEGVFGNDLDEDRSTPDNQFDLFYAMDMGSMAFGVRLNYQAFDESRSDRSSSRVTGGLTYTGSLDAALEHRAANLRNQNALDPGFVVNPFVGSVGVDNGDRESASLDGSEINLSLGFQLKEMGIDGALLLGKASGTYSVSEIGSSASYSFIDDSGQQRRRVESEVNESSRTTVDIDDGLTIGLALRGLVMETANSTLHASFSYTNQDYSGTLSRTNVEDSINYSYAGTTGSDYLVRNGEARNLTDQRWTGTTKDERQNIFLGAAYALQATNNTTVTAVTGVNWNERSIGRSYGTARDVVTVTQTGTNAGPQDSVTERTYNSALGTTHSWNADIETLAIPLVLAMEHSFNERWTVRASASKNLYESHSFSETTTEFGTRSAIPRDADTTGANQDRTATAQPERSVATSTSSFSYDNVWSGETTVAVGFGYTRGGFTLDAHLQNEFFTDSLNNNGPFGSATITYNW